MSKVTKSEREESIALLRDWLSEGDTVYCILRSVSRSGLSRQVSPLALEKYTTYDGRETISDCHLAYHVARVLGWSYRENTGNSAVVVDGCGMDAAAHMVDSLSRVLFGKGDALRYRWL